MHDPRLASGIILMPFSIMSFMFSLLKRQFNFPGTDQRNPRQRSRTYVQLFRNSFLDLPWRCSLVQPINKPSDLFYRLRVRAFPGRDNGQQFFPGQIPVMQFLVAQVAQRDQVNRRVQLKASAFRSYVVRLQPAATLGSAMLARGLEAEFFEG